IEALTHGIVNKILHTPMRNLKSAATGPELTTLIESFRKIFDLPETSARREGTENKNATEDQKKVQGAN
ncbi:MAG TPA: hypothetical protein VF447_18090, partial [Terriglobales bacterium]